MKQNANQARTMGCNGAGESRVSAMVALSRPPAEPKRSPNVPTNAIFVQHSLRTLLTITLLFAVHFALREWWISSRVPTRGGLIPLALAILVSAWIGWTKRSANQAAAFACFVAMLSSASIAAETILGSAGTEFLRNQGMDTQYNMDVELNAIAVAVFSFIALFGGWCIGGLASIASHTLATPSGVPGNDNGEPDDAREPPS